MSDWRNNELPELTFNEIIKDIPGYEGKYAITNHGRIWSYPLKNVIGVNHNGKWLKPSISHNKYYRLHLSINGKIKTYFVHRLVAYTYMKKPTNKTEINHINGNKIDNRVENLEWCTSSENQQHAFKTGLQKIRYGKNNPIAKSVKCIETGIIYDTLTMAAKDIECSIHLISKCLNEKTRNKKAKGYTWEKINVAK